MGSSLSSLTLETLFTPNSKMHKLFNTATSITTLQHLITASAYLTMWHNNGHCTVVHVVLCLKPHCVCYCRMHKERLDLLLVACDASIIACPCHFGIHSIMMHDAWCTTTRNENLFYLQVCEWLVVIDSWLK